MVRSDPVGKPDFTLLPLEILERWASHMGANVESKGRENWRNADGPQDVLRCQQSAWRHFVAWLRGDTDEDHAMALFFNVSVAEHARRSPTTP